MAPTLKMLQVYLGKTVPERQEEACPLHRTGYLGGSEGKGASTDREGIYAHLKGRQKGKQDGLSGFRKLALVVRGIVAFRTTAHRAGPWLSGSSPGLSEELNSSAVVELVRSRHSAVVVTDGERILGLGDLGCYGMGIPVGKLALYTACGGVNPRQCLPVLLDVGTNNEGTGREGCCLLQELLRDPLYIGLKHRRVRGQEYDDLLDEFMQAVTDKFGINCLIQFEDFANANAFRLLNKYRNKYCMFNDDIQGTASVAVAGILAALRITKNKLSNHVFVFQGAGEAAMGIAHLLVMALEKEGVSKAEATRKIWMVDSKGLIVKGRSHLNHEKEVFAQDHPEVNSLEEVVRLVKPTAIIGVAAIAGAFTEQILRDMASFHERPIIFALSNPTSKAECTAEKCYQVTEGRGIFASGSPFKSVTLEDGRTFIPGQGNNAYVFPGVALGVMAGGIRHIPDEIFLLTAEQIAQEVSEQHLSQGRLYPPLSAIRDVSLRIAIKVLDFAYKHNLASYYPEPKDKEAFVRSLVYTPDYDSFTLDSYTWPKEAMNVQNV
ncbi:NADP-dependent malic enzyme, mitochondrial [Camelus ferus]|nr:NADP-dependent malic enzyme, mitochondrial [Camelus ferus]